MLRILRGNEDRAIVLDRLWWSQNLLLVQANQFGFVEPCSAESKPQENDVQCLREPTILFIANVPFCLIEYVPWEEKWKYRLNQLSFQKYKYFGALALSCLKDWFSSQLPDPYLCHSVLGTKNSVMKKWYLCSWFLHAITLYGIQWSFFSNFYLSSIVFTFAKSNSFSPFSIFKL